MTSPNHRLDFAPDIDFSAILTNPILDIAARVWEQDRYDAFKICYRSMRRIDDLVDNRKSTGQPVTPFEAQVIERMMFDWVEGIRRGEKTDRYQVDFLQTVERFRLPFWPWERLAKAMTYDLQHDGFANFQVFLRYTEGAAIAPAAVFMHLCGIYSLGDRYASPRFDIRLAARPLAIFSYLVHIMRDFEKDTNANLVYFSDDLLHRYKITRHDLITIADSGIPTPNFRALMADYRHRAAYYRAKARKMIDELQPELAPRYQASLELIYQLYSQIYERIYPDRGLFTAEALQPPPQEIQKRIASVLARFGASTT